MCASVAVSLFHTGGIEMYGECWECYNLWIEMLRSREGILIGVRGEEEKAEGRRVNEKQSGFSVLFFAFLRFSLITFFLLSYHI